MARSKLRVFAAAAAGTAMVAVVVSCSLGLDESKIQDQIDATFVDDVTQPDVTGGGDGGDGGTLDGATSATACAKNEDCVAPNACATARCDLLAKRCVYDVCRPMACNASACDPATKACGAPAPYKFSVTKFPVGAPAQRMVAVYPWLFVQTAVGIVAFDISNPTSDVPPKVTISGLGFVPTQMVATANRVFFMTGPSGPGNLPTSTIPIAYVDVPSDPFVAKIEAKGTLATFSRPGNEGVVMIARENDTVLLYSTTPGPTPTYNATIVQPPFVEPATFTTTPLVYQAGFGPLNVMSGARFLMQNYNAGAGVYQFALVDNAGSAMPTNAGAYSFADAGPHGPSQAFAVLPNGSVFWSSASLTAAPVSPDPPSLMRAARAQFLFNDPDGGYDRPSSFDMELYNPPVLGGGTQVVGPAALLDPDTALVLTAAREAPTMQTSVQIAKRNPLGLVKDADVGRRAVLAVPLGTFQAAAAANGIGYAVANETMPGPNATVYVFAVDCAP